MCLPLAPNGFGCWNIDGVTPRGQFTFSAALGFAGAAAPKNYETQQLTLSSDLWLPK